MALLVLIGQMIFGTEKGPCQTCGKPGWKQTSIVDPLSPSLKIFCKLHHKIHDDKTKRTWNKCYYCDKYKNTEVIPSEVHMGGRSVCKNHVALHKYNMTKCYSCESHLTFIEHHKKYVWGKERVCLQHASWNS
jgi:hypothetical protein